MELNFQQRWEFIRDNSSDSTSNDSKRRSGGERDFNEVIHLNGTVLDEDGESTEASRFQKKSSKEPSTSGKNNTRKQKEERKGKERQAVHTEKRKGKSCRKSARKRKVGKAAALKSLENYTNSLVEDLKVARQDLVIWMRKQVQEIIGEETAFKEERRKCSISRENFQQQKPDIFEQTQAQHRNYFPKNTQVQHQNKTGKCRQGQQQSKSKNNSTAQHRTGIVSIVEVNHQKNFPDSDQLWNQGHLLHGTKPKKFNGENKERFGKRKRLARSTKTSVAQGFQVDHSLAIVPATASGKIIEETPPSPAKSKSETGPPNYQRKNIVLGIRAQSCNDNKSTRASRGKRTGSCQNSHPKHDPNQWQLSSSILPTEKHQKGVPTLSSEPNFSGYSSSYIASLLQSPPPLPLASMKPLHAAKNMPDPASFSSSDPAFVPDQTGLNSTTLFNKLLGSSDGNRYFQTLQPQESSLSLLGARNFQAQHYPLIQGNDPYRNQSGIENQLKQSNNMSMPSVMMNGGVAGLSGQCYFSSSEQYFTNSFLSHPAPNTDSRLLSCQSGFQFQK